MDVLSKARERERSVVLSYQESEVKGVGGEYQGQ